MESEAAQTAPTTPRDLSARCGTAGTLTYIGDDPRPLTYVLDGYACMPRPDERGGQGGLVYPGPRLSRGPGLGTHWLWEVTSMLLQGKAEYDSRPKEELMVEFIDVDKLEKTPSPRILNSHLPFYMLPWQQMKGKRTKILYVYRNPKDSCVSFYHHFKAFDESPIHDMAFNDFCELFFFGKLPFDNYFWHMKQVTTFVEENPDLPVLTLSFEDMKKNPLENVKRLAKFLELDVDEQLCEDITDACSFNNLKKGAALKKIPLSILEMENAEKKPPPLEFYRKGEIGDWKNYFTVAMSEKMDGAIKDRMEGLPYGLQYS